MHAVNGPAQAVVYSSGDGWAFKPKFQKTEEI
jgi:hypothetical protein